MIAITLLVFLALSPIFTLCQDGPIANSPSGPVLGVTQTSRRGIYFYAFRGIRFAEQPEIFKPPVPVQPWNEVYDATQDGPICMQPDREPRSEDCLRLNIFTRRINNATELRPVLVYIHGGSFAGGSCRSDSQGAQYLMDHDIVFVTIQYRLGTLGFFSTGDSYAPGNYGMKDQVEALRWIQRNIAAFGGDPSSVTISGSSAGGASIGLHLLSPMSRGLFHKAIALSGSSAINWATDRNPIEIAKKQAALLNCPTDTTENMVNCIKQKPAADIVQIYGQLRGWHNDPVVFLEPVIESEDYGIERFLTKDPLASLHEGDIANVPVIIGTTHDEFAYKANAILTNADWAADMSANWNTIAPISFIYEPNDNISQKLRQFYLGSVDQPIKVDSYDGLGKLYADSCITFGVVRSAKLMAEKNTEPIYLYQFNYQGLYNSGLWPGTNFPRGVGHGDDVIYVFSTANRPLFDLDSDDGRMVDAWTGLWVNLMETGNPTSNFNVTWRPLNNAEPSYLDVNKELRVIDGLYYEERMSFWENLFPLYI